MPASTLILFISTTYFTPTPCNKQELTIFAKNTNHICYIISSHPPRPTLQMPSSVKIFNVGIKAVERVKYLSFAIEQGKQPCKNEHF